MCDLSNLPPSATQSAAIPKDAWKRMAGSWNGNQARMLYAVHELNYSLAEALAFSTQDLSDELLANIKSWQNSLTMPTLEESPERTQIREQLISASKDITAENVRDKVDNIAKLQSNFGFNALKIEATDLTLHAEPLVGLLVGSYMFNSGDRIDGNALFNMGLRQLTDSPEGIRQCAETARILENFFLNKYL